MRAAARPLGETSRYRIQRGRIHVKRVYRAVLFFVVSALAVGIVPASADVTVSIDQADGILMASVPPPGDLADHPEQIVDEFTGSAVFSSADGAVFVQLSQKPVGGTMDPFDPGSIGSPADYIVIYTGEADL